MKTSRLIAITLPLLCWPALAQPKPNGRQLFSTRCAPCHGADGRGGERGPDITSKSATSASLRDLISGGLPERGMPATRLREPDLAVLIAHVLTLMSAPRSEPAVQSLAPPLPFDNVAKPLPGEWPTYHGQLSGNRHSPLRQIDAANVGTLVPKWMFPVPGAERLQNTPLVAGGVMYVTAPNAAYAIDPRSGRRLWSYQRPRTKGLAGDAAGGINRGVAILNDRLFMVTDHAHLIALDRRSGKLVWDVAMADYRRNYGATSAPLIAGDLVISGISGGDEGVRGFLDAYRASTGERVWRFWTIPASGEPLSETWSGKALEHGCATTWLTGTYDPASGLLYWPTGNPCPDYNGDQRRGDNLYSDSVLALDARTGKLRWHYQYTPHDLHDWDAQQTPMLVDARFRDRDRKLLVQANRNGFFYVLDRLTGEPLLATPFVEKLTWATAIGPDWRPVLVPGNVPTAEGKRICPSVEGATNWMSSAFNPATRLFYVMALEKCNVYVKAAAVWEPGKSYYGGDTRKVSGETGRKYLRALDLDSGKIVWQFGQDGTGESWGGLLSTAGGLLFYCDDSGDFAALDAANGKQLWRFPANQLWKASPMTYEIDGKQYVAIAAGANIIAFGLP